jgi:transposase-like protein
MISFKLDDARIHDVAREFGASEKQLLYAYSRALKRTAGTLRRITVSGIKTELGMKNANALRKRIKLVKSGGDGWGGSAKLWVGTNPMSYSLFKGKPTKVPGGIKVGKDTIFGAFFASPSGGAPLIFKRRGFARLPIDAQKRDIHDQVVTYLEDNVYVDLGAIFFKHFFSEVRSRTIYGVGKS